ncbi:MAG: hypothetical protein ACJ75B_04325 [Flavisolibacter sp.]
MRYIFLFAISLIPIISFAQKTKSKIPTDPNQLLTRFDTSRGRETPTYEEIIAFWKKMDAASPMVKMMEMGPTDAGYPLHLVLVSSDKDFDITSIKAKKKIIILINNGIHPGEPDGIDASISLVKHINRSEVHSHSAQTAAGSNFDARLSDFDLPFNVVLAIIPVYNIGGCLNRSKDYRVDQNGPEEFGFRGNSQNLDLNRDFIKADTKEALSFTRIFHYLDPDIFIDNHVSDGADYQHVMTLISSQHNKLGGRLGEYLNKNMEPAIYSLMKEKGYDLVPYVNHFGDLPEKGWPEFWDSPRYSTGYTSLWGTFSFMPETHMLKPYPQRVASAEALLKSFIEFASVHAREIIQLRQDFKKQVMNQTRFPLAWKLDRSHWSEIEYRGYEASQKTSEVSGFPRLYYDRSKPFDRKIPFYNVYTDTFSVDRPQAYIIPQGWWKVIDRLQANGVQMRRLAQDTSVEVQWYRIESFQSGQRPYEGHHPNSNVQISVHTKVQSFRKGDYFIPLNQAANRFLTETLEPQAEDSYFTWNFFDGVLGQKEGFSDYHFEDIAAEYLKNNPGLKARLDQRKASDSAFAKNAGAQLNFVFQNSPWMEPAYLEYPVYRVER